MLFDIVSTKIDVVVLVYNRLRSTIRSIDCILSDDNLKKLYILDDGSTLDNYKILQEKYLDNEKIEFLRNHKNMGYSYNLEKGLLILSKSKADLVFLCESDMLLDKSWGQKVIKGFNVSPDTVCITPMLQASHFNKKHEKRHWDLCAKYFGKSSPASLPSYQKLQLIDKDFSLKYVSSSIGTMIFKRDFFTKISYQECRNHKKMEDGWLSWQCFHENNFLPTSLGALDPGVAFTMATPGVSGQYPILRNKRWNGSFFWRSKIISSITRFFYKYTLYSIGILNGTIKIKLRSLTK